MPIALLLDFKLILPVPWPPFFVTALMFPLDAVLTELSMAILPPTMLVDEPAKNIALPPCSLWPADAANVRSPVSP